MSPEFQKHQNNTVFKALKISKLKTNVSENPQIKEYWTLKTLILRNFN